MKYFIPQIDQTDCGYACLKMLIAHLYQNENALYIRQDENRGPYSLKELQDEAEKYGITLQGIEVNDKSAIKEIRLPYIALLKKKNEVYHYVLVTKVKYGMVYYSDPSEGESSLSIKSFIALWTGDSLIIEDFLAIDNEFSEAIKEDKKPFVLTSILQIVNAAFLLMGIYFIDDKSKIYLPILFLSLSLVSEIILRVHLVKSMEKMDIEFFNGISIERKRYYQFYERYEDYKKKVITSRMNIIFSFILILFITGITLFNNIYNAFLVLIPLFISIIDVKFVDNMIKEKDELICIEENEITTIKNIDIFKRQLEKIHLRGYKLARLTLVKKSIYISLIMITALVTTAFNETFSLPYAIFYFAIGYMLLEQYSGFMRYPRNQKELLIAKVKLNNVFERL